MGKQHFNGGFVPEPWLSAVLWWRMTFLLNFRKKKSAILGRDAEGVGVCFCETPSLGELQETPHAPAGPLLTSPSAAHFNNSTSEESAGKWQDSGSFQPLSPLSCVFSISIDLGIWGRQRSTQAKGLWGSREKPSLPQDCTESPPPSFQHPQGRCFVYTGPGL